VWTRSHCGEKESQGSREIHFKNRRQGAHIFVFASDGILESMNAHEEQFGFERLAETLPTVRPDTSSGHLCTAILAATDKFSGRPEEPHDDRTLVILRIN
jgi:serine phosphatase RsbU (regulator of sigma subunit)